MTRERMLRFIIKIIFKRDWQFWYRFVRNLLDYTYAKITKI